MKKALTILFTYLFISLFITGCSPEIGSEEWCLDLKEKEKIDWTGREIKDYAQHCIFK